MSMTARAMCGQSIQFLRGVTSGASRFCGAYGDGVEDGNGIGDVGSIVIVGMGDVFGIDGEGLG